MFTIRGPLSAVVSSENSDHPLPPSEKRSPRGRMSSEMSPSPSSVCRHRRHSPVLVTPGGSMHDLAEGRTVITVPRSGKMKSRSSSGSGSSRRCSDGSPSAVLPKKVERASTVSTDQSQMKYLSDPLPLRLDAWTEPPGSSFQVRGGNYLEDKVKAPSQPSFFTLLTADLVKSPTPMLGGLCAHPEERIQRALARERNTGVKELPEFIFAVNLVIPGYHMVSYFGCDDLNLLRNPSTGFERIANKFFFGPSDDFRNQSFKVRQDSCVLLLLFQVELSVSTFGTVKISSCPSRFQLIPRIVEGNYLVRKAVGTKPAILGKKLKQIYIRTERFCEVIVDIDSDSVARKITKLSLGYVSAYIFAKGKLATNQEAESNFFSHT
jgi:Protein ENHANCED DISEASE RESISTANCE 2, C-terminal